MRDLVTTALDLIGLVSVVVAVSLYVARFGAPYGVGTFGLGLLGVSVLIELRAPKPVPDHELD